MSFTDGTWAVADPVGRYDAFNGGEVKGLHWVVGNEPIDLVQLKQHYFDPGLLAKHLGFNHKALRCRGVRCSEIISASRFDAAGQRQNGFRHSPDESWRRHRPRGREN